MRDHFMQLFEYDAWANAQVLECMELAPLENPKIELLFSHILNAQKIWLARCLDTGQQIDTWVLNKDLKGLMIENVEGMKNYFQKLNDGDFEQTVTYKNSKGVSFENCLKDILTHLVNHGTYHRGQIVQLLKAERAKVPMTDYIFWRR